MIIIGASTANLYPDNTEDALETLLELGFRELEIFLNTESETTAGYIASLLERTAAFGARIRAVHPYTSFMEPYLLFSAYRRRWEDGIHVYDHLFETAATLGADYFVLHGDRLDSSLPLEEFAERYGRLYDKGRQHGVMLLQENVARFRSRMPAFVRDMRRMLGDRAQFVLDVKQCARSGIAVDDMVEAMGEGIRHVHISDHDDERDCLLPGHGYMEYGALFASLRQNGFDGAVMLELYREDFGRPEELWEAKQHLEAFLPDVWSVL